jgi:hypothetical protein
LFPDPGDGNAPAANGFAAVAAADAAALAVLMAPQLNGAWLVAVAHVALPPGASHFALRTLRPISRPNVLPGYQIPATPLRRFDVDGALRL